MEQVCIAVTAACGQNWAKWKEQSGWPEPGAGTHCCLVRAYSRSSTLAEIVTFFFTEPDLGGVFWLGLIFEFLNPYQNQT